MLSEKKKMIKKISNPYATNYAISWEKMILEIT